MLGLYEIKHLVGEINYHRIAQKYIYCEHRLFKHTVWMRFNCSKGIVALKGKTYF